MKLTLQDLENLFFEGEITVDGVHLTVVEEGSWISEHKSESCELIFTDGSNFYQGSIRRSGSYFRGYDYDSELYGSDELADIDEVIKAVVSVEKWVVV